MNLKSVRAALYFTLGLVLAAALLAPYAQATVVHPVHSAIVMSEAPATASTSAAASSSGGMSLATWIAVFGLVAYFTAAIITHMECVKEKRGCYEHKP